MGCFLQALEEQARDFPEQLRRERAAVGTQYEEQAVLSAVAQKTAELEHRFLIEKQRAETAESELKVLRDHCRSLESQLRSSCDSVLTQAETFSKELQAQTARADEATAMWREAEANTRQCRRAMQLDADRLQVLFRRALCACVYCCIFPANTMLCGDCVCMF